MYKKQVKLHRIICLALLIISAVIFVYSLGIMTDLYDSLYSTYRRGKSSIEGAGVYMDMQDFNKNFLLASWGEEGKLQFQTADAAKRLRVLRPAALVHAHPPS